jgi:hydroxylamine reductase
MEKKMFCFQCQETAFGTGCTFRGVCGKLPQTARYQDLLISIVRGVGTIYHELRASSIKPIPDVETFLYDALFSTITNANFDDESILRRVDSGLLLKAKLTELARKNQIVLPDFHEVTWDGERADYEHEAERETVLRNTDPDIRSLKELITLGLKGMSAYGEHAARLDFHSQEIIDFMASALAVVSNPESTKEQLLQTVLATGQHGVKVMALLDQANTKAFGNPEMTKVNIGVGTKPGILNFRT